MTSILLDLRQQACVEFRQSDEKLDGASDAQGSCGVAHDFSFDLLSLMISISFTSMAFTLFSSSHFTQPLRILACHIKRSNKRIRTAGSLTVVGKRTHKNDRHREEQRGLIEVIHRPQRSKPDLSSNRL